MSLDRLHDELMANEEYRMAFAEEDLIHRVALRVLQLRKGSGMSQAELAELLGTRQPAIAKIEAGGANLTLRRVARIAHALDIDPAALVTTESPDSAYLRWTEKVPGMSEYTLTTTTSAMRDIPAVSLISEAA